MAAPTEARMVELLRRYLAHEIAEPHEGHDGPTFASMAEVYEKLAAYLDLLLRWNARTNLTSVRDPEGIIRRHFGESLFAARVLAGYVRDGCEVLDFGSGAGFPGIPVALMLPRVRVTLGESQGKKAAFLREAVRTLGLPSEVWARRVEELPADRRFDAVMMRAADKAAVAESAARGRVRPSGWLMKVAAAEPFPALARKIAGPEGTTLALEHVL